MLESLTIFTPGGLILYQYLAQPSLFPTDNSEDFTRTNLNATLIQKILLSPSTNANTTYHIADGITFCWKQQQPLLFYVVAVYPDIQFEGPRADLKQWAERLVEQTCQEYSLFYNATKKQQEDIVRPDPTLFDPTFQIVLETSKNQKSDTSMETKQQQQQQIQQQQQQTQSDSKKKKGKEKRIWGEAKVTDKAMAELDMNKKASGSADDAHERALQEARQAYLPTEEDLKNAQEVITITAAANDSDNNEQSSYLGSLFQQLTGNKVLTAADLEKPCQHMAELLKTKNVAASIANELTESVKQQLIGNKLKSLYSIQTAVQQALERSLTKLLMHNQVDLLRNVLEPKSQKEGVLSKLSTKKQPRPYVISVMGINGIGKTTSLAKLAYYFQQHGCNPLLVAGDTFRSGAVEQLKVHADCLNIPLFSQGYSKDPSSVAAAAIQHAEQTNVDVVLIDTAGRMQNNVPLMKALGKLVSENQPDFCVLVCEALVGHDGLNQFEMFQKAAKTNARKQGIDGLILTKFDTVDTKVGASLTLTHETGTPIVFLGVGQKYHHLQKLSVPTVIQSLFMK